MIEYEVTPNPLTTPPSYALRVRPRGTLGGDELNARIAQEVALDPATVTAVLDGLEIRSRRSPGGPLHATRWPTALHTAGTAPARAARAKKAKA